MTGLLTQFQKRAATGPTPANLAVELAGITLPHPKKGETGGEDSLFTLPADFGVFDGVGGWAQLGYDPAAYTREFAVRVAQNISTQRAIWDRRDVLRTGPPRKATFKGVDLVRALEHAVDTTPGVGSCTACVLSFDSASGLVTGLNLGDSGALLLRADANGKPFVAYRTRPQQHKFNLPFQLGTNSTDTPESAEPFIFYAREGDILVAATDGLLDNMFDEDIALLVNKMAQRKSTGNAKAMAQALALRAFNLSLDKGRESPWQRASARAKRSWASLFRRKQKGESVSPGQQGGKMDDITVVVGRVTKKRPAPVKPGTAT